MVKGVPWILGGVAVVSITALALVFLVPTGGDGAAGGQTLTDGGRNGVEFIGTYNETRAGVSKFYVRIETHTVSLDAYDVFTSILLDHGPDSLRPSSPSKIDSRSSHHIAATLYFETGSTHDSLTLVAEDLGGVPERRLDFDP